MSSATRSRAGVVRRTVAGIGVVALAALALAPAASADSASPSAAATGTAATKTTLTIGMQQDIDSLNPFTGIAAAAYEVYQLQYPTLTSSSVTDFAAVPSLAESWTESADKTTWTYKIRSGVTWSDGVPLTAKDVAYSFNRVMTGDYEQTNYGSYVKNITSVTAPDDTTVVMKVSKPSPIMLHLAVYILPEHVWKNVSEAQVKSFANEPTGGQPLVGAGPFQVVERRTKQFIRLQANPSYYGGTPKIDEVVFRIYNNADSLAQALKKGEIDVADSLENNVYTSLANQPGITQFPAEYSGFDELAFNTGAALADGKPIGDGSALLKDKKLRAALAWAIDRQGLVDKVLGGQGTAGDSIVPPIYTTLHWTPSDAQKQGYDPAKAATLLDEAGYKVGSDGIRAAADGTKLSFRLFCRSESPTSQKSCDYIKGWLKAVGVEINSKVISEDSLTEVVGQGNYDMFEWGWVVEPDPDYQLSTFTCDKRSYVDGGTVYADLSDSFYCNPAYDALYTQQAGETDVAKRADTVKKMQEILYEDTPYVVTYYYNNLEAYRSDRFTGFLPQPQPKGSLLFQYGVWSYVNVAPTSAQAAGSTSTSGVPWAAVGGLVAAVVLLGGGALIISRRRGNATADERE